MRNFLTCLLVVLVLLLPACQASLAFNLAASPGATLFRDDFSDASARWPQLTSPDGSMSIVDGAYRFQIHSSHFKILAASGHVFKDVSVEADLTRLAGPEQNIAGLVCRSNGTQDFYFFVVSSDGFYALGKNIAGKTTLFGQKSMVRSMEIKPGEKAYHLRLTCAGSSLSGYVNGTLIATGSAEDLRYGDIGFLVGSTDDPDVDVAFDNLLVIKP